MKRGWAAGLAGPVTLEMVWLPELVLLGAMVLLVVSASSLELTFDESYYVMWAAHPRWSYLDHPPLVGWLWVTVEGLGPRELVTRLPALACGLVTVWCVMALARDVVGGANARVATATLAASFPLWWSSVLVSPDAPLMACWAAAILLYHRASAAGRLRSFVVAGIPLGLALLSKYTAVLLVACLVAHLWTSSPTRQRVRATLGLLAPAVALFCPVLWWNLHNNGASFVFQWSLGPRHLDAASGLTTLADFAAGQVLLAGPLLLWASWIALRKVSRFRRDPGTLLLVWTGVGPLVVCAVLSLRHAVEANWVLPAWLSLVVLAAWARPRLCLLSATGFFVLAALVAFHMQRPLVDVTGDFTGRFVGWRALSMNVEECAREARLVDWYILGDSRRETTQVSYYLGGRHPARPTSDVGRFFFLDPRDTQGHPAVLLVEQADATPAVLEQLATRAGLTVAHTCGVASRRRANGRAVESFVLVALVPEAAEKPVTSSAAAASPSPPAWRP